MTIAVTGKTSGVRQIEFLLFHVSHDQSFHPCWSINLTSQTNSIMTAVDRNNVILSGSNTRSEWMLKNRGVAIRANNQPASKNPSHQRVNFEFMRSPISFVQTTYFNDSLRQGATSTYHLLTCWGEPLSYSVCKQPLS